MPREQMGLLKRAPVMLLIIALPVLSLHANQMLSWNYDSELLMTICITVISDVFHLLIPRDLLVGA